MRVIFNFILDYSNKKEDDKETPMVVKIKAAKDMAIRW